MFALIVFIFSIAVVLGVGVLAAWSDVKSMTIPNYYSVIVIAVFVLCYGVMAAAGQDVFMPVGSHFLAVLIVFFVSAAMFYFKLMGAADSKLASAYAFWLGMNGLVPFLFYMALGGGLLAMAALILMKKKPFQNPEPGSWFAQVQQGGSKVPYGVAIVFGVFVSFGFLGYFDYGTLAGFLRDGS